MVDYYCIVIIVCLIIGFILGRWRIKEYCGDVIVSTDSETCTFALDIPADSIHEYSELVFRVIREEGSENV